MIEDIVSRLEGFCHGKGGVGQLHTIASVTKEVAEAALDGDAESLLEVGWNLRKNRQVSSLWYFFGEGPQRIPRIPMSSASYSGGRAEM